jgi:RNA polymerase sigma-70 factor (sigma-E family)
MSEVAVAQGAGSQGTTSEERFDVFVAARGPALWRSAWLLTGDRHLAEDLVQTALAKSWPHWKRIEDEGRFEAHVRRTLFPTYVAWWRRKWNGERPTERPPEQPATAIDADLGQDLMTALAGLPRMQRAVVVCRWFEDLSEAQTADRLGIAVGTVKSHGSRALTALRSSPHLREQIDD